MILHWSPESMSALTMRQAKNYYYKMAKMSNAGGDSEGGTGSGEKSHDLNEIFAEADTLGIPRPPG